MTENYILTSVNGPVVTIRLNRPDKRNALNHEMISELLASLKKYNQSDEVRIIVLKGSGSSFCSGADLNWMLNSSELPDQENLSECEDLASCFFHIYHSQKITICFVHGSSMGGANGIVASCDIAVALDNAQFGFPEVRAGIFPATIAPYVLNRTGPVKAHELMITGRKFGAAEALRTGLIDRIVKSEESESFLKTVINDILSGSPEVQKKLKAMRLQHAKLSADQSVINDTAAILAQSRSSPEAHEGIIAAMQKRKPVWYTELK